MSMWALAGASVLSGLFGAKSATKAADAQVEAAEKTVEEQRRQYDTTREDLAPYRSAGYNALGAIQGMLGLTGSESGTGLSSAVPDIRTVTEPVQGAAAGGSDLEFRGTFGSGDGMQAYLDGQLIGTGINGENDKARLQAMYGNRAPVQQTTNYLVGDQSFGTMTDAEAYRSNLQAAQPTEGYDFQTSPGYQFRLDEGNKAMERAASARGLRLSSGTMKDAMRYGQGLASDEYWTQYNALAGLAGTGQTAVNTGAQLGAQTANQIGNAYMAAGDARASGYAGVNNAFQGTMGNLFSVYSMNQAGAFG